MHHLDEPRFPQNVDESELNLLIRQKYWINVETLDIEPWQQVHLQVESTYTISSWLISAVGSIYYVYIYIHFLS